jgi:uncharacterized membrane protein
MEDLQRIVLGVHVVAGLVGLSTMFPPLLARKGGRLHRRVGFVFVYAMATVVVSGFVLAAQWLLAPALFRPGVSAAQARLDAVFLVSIAGLTANAIVQATSAIRRKRRPQADRTPIGLVSLAALALCALAALAVGIAQQHVLSIVFGLGGLLQAGRDARFSLRPVGSRHAYLYQHVSAIGTACISAVTAFLVLGGRRLFHVDTFGASAWLAWLLPGALGAPVFQLWIHMLKRKLEGRRAPSPATPLDVTA